MKNKIITYIAFFFFFFQGLIFSQFSAGLSSEQEYNSNPFKSIVPESNLISLYDLILQYKTGDWGFLYNVNSTNFNTTTDRNFYWHSIGIWKSFDTSILSFSAEQRINKELYTFFDYYELNLAYEHQFSFFDIDASLFPSVVYTSYKNISVLSNVKTSMGFTLNKSFETGTTIIFGGMLNHKIYTDPNKTDLIQALDDSNRVVDNIIESKNTSSITQLSGFGRIAQAITPSTGLAFQFTNKKIVNGLASSVKELNLTYGDESEIFDDPVNYEGNNILVELTQILFTDLELKLGYYYNNKKYPSQGIYNANAEYNLNIERNDTQNVFSFSAQKTFSLSEKLSLDLEMNFHYIKNSSNSYFFKYNSSSFGLNVSLSF